VEYFTSSLVENRNIMSGALYNEGVDPLNALTEINLDDLVSSFGWQDHRLLAGLLRGSFRAPSAKFARLMLEFDDRVGQDGLPGGARHTLQSFARSVQVYGSENVPANGPALFLSNHPGMVDTLALFAAINRPDLRIIALNRPFLLSLPHTSAQLFFISDDPAGRMGALKKAAAHLRSGGALLTFPAGHIEPDADVYPGASQALAEWSESAGVLARFAPETRIVPVFVRGVLWEKAVRHPLTRFKKDRQEREKMGAALQLLAHILFNARPLDVKVQFAAPLSLGEAGSEGLPELHASIIARMRAMTANAPAGAGLSALA
jgi:1-acyl-sn-glycerol-3-phosphate acyltransferase